VRLQLIRGRILSLSDDLHHIDDSKRQNSSLYDVFHRIRDGEVGERAQWGVSFQHMMILFEAVAIVFGFSNRKVG
jgi:hypothetical protein